MKLGSRKLAEFKEARDTESMRSQTNAARRKQWGTDDRYMFLQVSSRAKREQAKWSLLPRAAKLADIANRSQAYWKATYYEEHKEHLVNVSKAAALAKMKNEVHKTDKPAKKQLGLTAQQSLAKGRKDAMKIVRT